VYLKKTEEGSGWLAGRQVGSWAGNLQVGRHVSKPAGTDSGRLEGRAAGMDSGKQAGGQEDEQARQQVWVQACTGRKSK
jgi:hypothetical protein